jgi:hypothetical protein
MTMNATELCKCGQARKGNCSVCTERREKVRTVIFKPYNGTVMPRFRLELFSGNFGRYGTGQECMGYRLTQLHADKSKTVIFEANDYGRAPGDTEDGNGTVVGIMTFLTLRPGDTDADYFKDYTPEQTAFASEHAEWLSGEVQARFCDENGNVKRAA